MPIYRMQCANPHFCGRPFDWIEKAGAYEIAKRVAESAITELTRLRDVAATDADRAARQKQIDDNEGVFRGPHCRLCGYFGARRIYPPGSVAKPIVEHGTWQHGTAPPGLEGVHYASKEEKVRQLAAVAPDQAFVDWGLDKGRVRPHGATHVVIDAAVDPVPETLSDKISAFMRSNPGQWAPKEIGARIDEDFAEIWKCLAGDNRFKRGGHSRFFLRPAPDATAGVEPHATT